MAKSSQARTSDGRHRDAGRVRPTPGRAVVESSLPSSAAAAAMASVPDALGLFERGMASLQRRDYRAALSQFNLLAERFPTEGPLVDRARVYAARCHRELAPPPDDSLRPPDERLAAATAALNNGDDEAAAHLAASVLVDAPGHDHAHYLMAVVHARRGAVVEALDALRRAIALSPDVRVQARHDLDFDVLRDTDAFALLVADPAAHSDTPSKS